MNRTTRTLLMILIARPSSSVSPRPPLRIHARPPPAQEHGIHSNRAMFFHRGRGPSGAGGQLHQDGREHCRFQLGAWTAALRKKRLRNSLDQCGLHRQVHAFRL